MATNHTYIEPFNVKLLVHNYFLGTTNLFIFAFVVVFSIAAAKYQMSNRVFLILLSLGSLMFFTYIGESMLVIILFILGVVVFKSTSKIVT